MTLQQVVKKTRGPGRTRLEGEIETVLMGVKLPKTIKDEFDNAAYKMGLSPSKLARIVLKNFLNRNSKKGSS